MSKSIWEPHHHFVVLLRRVHRTWCLKGSRLLVEVHTHIACLGSIVHTIIVGEPEWSGWWRTKEGVSDILLLMRGVYMLSLPELDSGPTGPGS